MNHSSSIYAAFGLACTLMLCAGCRNNNDVTPANPNSQTIVVADSSEFTGSLEVRIVNTAGGSVANAVVQLYATYEDYANNIFLFTLVSNSSGFVNFGFVNFGNYYIKAELVGSNVLTNAPGTIVQVRARRLATATITVR